MNVTAIQTTIISGRIAISADLNRYKREKLHFDDVFLGERGGRGAMRFVI